MPLLCWELATPPRVLIINENMSAVFHAFHKLKLDPAHQAPRIECIPRKRLPFGYQVRDVDGQGPARFYIKPCGFGCGK